MPYDLEIAEDVYQYLDGQNLSARGWAIVAAMVTYIADLPDDFRADPDNRVAPNSPLLRYASLYGEPDGSLHTIELIIDDSNAAAGVLRVRFAEHTAGPAP